MPKIWLDKNMAEKVVVFWKMSFQYAAGTDEIKIENKDTFHNYCSSKPAAHMNK